MLNITILESNFTRVYTKLNEISKSYNVKFTFSDPYVKQYNQILTEYRDINFDIDFKYQYICKLVRIHNPNKFEFKVQDEVEEVPVEYLNRLTDLRCSHCNKKLDNGYLFKVDDQYIILGRNCTDDFCGKSLKELLLKYSILYEVKKANDYNTKKNITPQKAFPTDLVLDILLDVGKDQFVSKAYENSTYSKLIERLSDYNPSKKYTIKEETKQYLSEIRATKGTWVESDGGVAGHFYHDYINFKDLGYACVIVSKRIRDAIRLKNHPEEDCFYNSQCIGEIGEVLEFIPNNIEFKGEFTCHNAFSRSDDLVRIFEINYNGNRLKLFTTANKDFTKLTGRTCTCKVKKHEKETNTTIIKLLKEKK